MYQIALKMFQFFLFDKIYCLLVKFSKFYTQGMKKQVLRFQWHNDLGSP